MANRDIVNFDPYSQSSTQEAGLPLGFQYRDEETGRVFRYAKVGASNISKGNLQLGPDVVANHVNCNLAAAAAVGDKSVSVTLGATAATLNQYAGGYMIINDVDGEGTYYLIDRHAAIGSAGTGTIYLKDAIKVALTTSTQVTFVPNRWNGVVEGTDATREGAGWPLIDMTAAYFGWLQTRGWVSATIGTAATDGSLLMADGSTAGAVTDHTDVTAPQTQVIVARQSFAAGVSTEHNPVYALID